MTIDTFLSELKDELAASGATPRLGPHGSILYTPPHACPSMCTVHFFARRRIVGEMTSLTGMMQLLGMSERDTWTIISANDGFLHMACLPVPVSPVEVASVRTRLLEICGLTTGS